MTREELEKSIDTVADKPNLNAVYTHILEAKFVLEHTRPILTAEKIALEHVSKAAQLLRHAAREVQP